MNQLPALIGVFAYLSLLTMGGGMAAFPELRVLTVDVHHWLTFPQLIHLYSVGQMAPGPNMMMVVSIGEWVAGIPGAVAVLIAFFLPTALLTFGVGRLWIRLETWPWRASIQRGLAPVSIGLILAGSISLAEGALTGRLTFAIAAAVFAVLLLFSRVNPALLVLCGALVSLFAFSPR
jgi:chromate transporter